MSEDGINESVSEAVLKGRWPEPEPPNVPKMLGLFIFLILCVAGLGWLTIELYHYFAG